MKNGIIGGAVFLTIAGVIGWQVYERIQQEQSSGQGKWRSGGGRRNAPVAVEVVEVKLQDITDKLFLTGTLEPESRFIVAPKVSGRLESLLVEMGDFVKKGQQLAKLDDAEAVQQTRMAEAALKTAKSSLEVSKETADQAEREFRRQKDLFGKGLTSQLQLENVKSQYLSRQANLRMAQSILSERRFSLETSRIRLSYTEIRINWEDDTPTRVVGERFVDPGSLLNANTPILSILNISTLTAIVSVTEMDYFKLRPGQAALVSVDALPNRKFPGRILRVAPFLHENSREARVEVQVPNPEGLLKPGMFVRVNVELERRQNARVVPLAAVLDRNGKGIFLADRESGTATFVQITPGIVDGEWLEVRAPEVQGLVVTLGQHLLRDGGTVMIAEPAKAASGRSRNGGGKWKGQQEGQGRATSDRKSDGSEGKGNWKGRQGGTRPEQTTADRNAGGGKKRKWQSQQDSGEAKGNWKGRPKNSSQENSGQGRSASSGDEAQDKSGGRSTKNVSASKD